MGESESSQNQIQKQINKQVITLKQDQNASNTILCKLLAELENLAITCGYKGEIYFDYYVTKGQKKNEIIGQIVYQMVIFESSYKHFVKTNPKKKYEFPFNLTYEQIVEIIISWKKFLNKDKSNAHLIKYYDSFYNILEGKPLDKSIKLEFANLDKDEKPTTKEDLNRMLNAGAIATSMTNEKNKDIEKEVIEKGDYKVKVVIGGKREDNKFYNMFEKNDENYKKIKKEIYNDVKIAIGYLEIYYQISLENKFKYSSKDEIKKFIYEKYEKCKDEFLAKIVFLTDNFNYDFFDEKKEKLNKIKKELSEWKAKIKNTNEKLKNELSNAINVFCLGKEDSIN